jgi:hypothetical protein
MTFGAATHLVHGDSAGEGVRAAGGRDVIVVKDLLTYGPCAVEPARHRRLRLAHWGVSEPAVGHDLDAVAGLYFLS